MKPELETIVINMILFSILSFLRWPFLYEDGCSHLQWASGWGTVSEPHLAQSHPLNQLSWFTLTFPRRDIYLAGTPGKGSNRDITMGMGRQHAGAVIYLLLQKWCTFICRNWSTHATVWASDGIGICAFDVILYFVSVSSLPHCRVKVLQAVQTETWLERYSQWQLCMPEDCGKCWFY